MTNVSLRDRNDMRNLLLHSRNTTAAPVPRYHICCRTWKSMKSITSTAELESDYPHFHKSHPGSLIMTFRRKLHQQQLATVPHSSITSEKRQMESQRKVRREHICTPTQKRGLFPNTGLIRSWKSGPGPHQVLEERPMSTSRPGGAAQVFIRSWRSDPDPHQVLEERCRFSSGPGGASRSSPGPGGAAHILIRSWRSGPRPHQVLEE